MNAVNDEKHLNPASSEFSSKIKYVKVNESKLRSKSINFHWSYTINNGIDHKLELLDQRFAVNFYELEHIKAGSQQHWNPL